MALNLKATAPRSEQETGDEAPGTCATCRFWSPLIARTSDDTIKALCRNPASAITGEYVTTRQSCTAQDYRHDNPFDPPGGYPRSAAP